MIMNFIADLDFLVDIIIFGIFKDILIHSFLSKLECISHFIQFSAYVLSYMRHDIEGVCVLGGLRRRRSLRSVWPSSERLYWSILLWHVANVLSTSSLLKTYLLKKIFLNMCCSCVIRKSQKSLESTQIILKPNKHIKEQLLFSTL